MLCMSSLCTGSVALLRSLPSVASPGVFGVAHLLLASHTCMPRCSSELATAQNCPYFLSTYCHAVHEEYLVPPAHYSFSLLLKPLDAAAASAEGGTQSLAERANAEWRAHL